MKSNVRYIRVDNYTRLCLTAIVALLTVLMVGLWVEYVPTASDATAAEAFLDSSAQRAAMVDAQKETNTKLDQIISVLKSGDVKVQVQKPEDAEKERAK